MARPTHSHTLSSSTLDASSPETNASSFWGGGGGGDNNSQVYSSTTTLPPGSALSSSSSSSPRKKMNVGGHVSRRVGMFSPTLEEDESGVFGSPIKDAAAEFRARGGSAVSSPISLKGGAGGVRKKAAAFEGGSGQGGIGMLEGGGRVYALGGVGGGERSSDDSARSSSESTTTQPLRLRPRRALPTEPTTSSSTAANSPSISAAPASPVSRFNHNPPSPASSPTRPVRCPPLDFPRSSSSSNNQTTPTTSPTKQRLSYTPQQQQPSGSTPRRLPSALSSSPSKPTTIGSPSTTTRALITRFETPLSTPHRQQQQQQQQQQITPSRQHLDKPLPSPVGASSSSTSPGKGRSPLRDGLKKLVGKFGGGKLMGGRRKKSGGSGWESGTDDEGLGGGRGNEFFDQSNTDADMDGRGGGRMGLTGSNEQQERQSEEERRRRGVQPPPEDNTYTLSPIPQQQSSTQPSSSSSSSRVLRTGPLFFYASASNPAHWLRTTASLLPGTLVLTSSSLRGEPNSRSISLRACQVVRSVPEREARERWVSPLWDDEQQRRREGGGGGDDDEDDDDEVHYLELGFGGQTEGVVVAVLSVGERLGWVSSIWDAILGGSNPLSPLSPQETNNPAFAAQPNLLPLDASPQDSLLDTPPVDPHALTLEGSYGLHQRGSLYITNSDEGHHQADVPQPRRESVHVRRPSDDGPPRLSRPKLGGNVEEIRRSVERMFGGQLFEGEKLTGGFPRGRTEELTSPEQRPLSTMSGTTEKSTSTGLSRAERMEDPSPLKPLGELALASRLRNQSHHQGGEGSQYFGSRPIPIVSSARRSDSNGSLGGPMISPNDGPSPSMVHSETPSFDISDLNPSRSASQIQRRTTPANNNYEKDASVLTGYTYNQRRQQERFEIPSSSTPEGQFEDLATPRSSLFHAERNEPAATTTVNLNPSQDPSSRSSSSSTSNPPASLSYSSSPQPPTAPPQPPAAAAAVLAADLTPIISMLSSNEAHSITRDQLFDLKLSSVQQGVVQLLERGNEPSSTAVSEEEERARMERLEMSLQGMGIDLKEVVEGLRLRTLSVVPVGLPKVGEAEEEQGIKEKVLLEEVNGKLDGILSRLEKWAAAAAGSSSSSSGGGAVIVGEASSSSREEEGDVGMKAGPPAVRPIEGIPGGKRFVVNPGEGSVVGREESREEGEVEVEREMRDEKSPVGTSSVLSNGTVASSQGPLSLPVAAELVEVLNLVKEQQSQRSLQTQQTSDIARYLNELNAWMEAFVKNGNQALDVVSTKVDHLTDLISPPPPATPQLGQGPVPMQQGIVGLLGEVRSLALELRDRADQGGGGANGGVGEAVQQRLEGVLAVMEQDRQRYQQQNSTIDGMMVMINQHKMENEQLLRAVAVDLSREIQGERLRFVDAMSQATSVNVNLHVEEFKKLLSQEVARSMHDLGRIREEKKHLEQQIAELFATKVKFSDGSRPTSQQPQPRRPSQPLASPHPPPQAPLPPVPSGGPALAPPRF